MDLLEYIKGNKKLNMLLMCECDIHFYKQSQETHFLSNHEIYSIPCEAFAQDGSGGEFVFLNDGSIGFISSEGEVGRIADNLEGFLTFLLHAGNIFDFNCKLLYQNQNLLKKYCDGYISKIRKSYTAENKDWDMIRSDIAKELNLPFNPNKLADLAMNFYQAATRNPYFSCKYTDGENEYICDSVLSDIVGLWVTELTGMTKEEIEISSNNPNFRN
ncbi:hypothetical protein HMPREF9628_01050 [Peptoanaerobacter stomatis]|uniref:Uncharacterized protein n=1 Tax=Peptoanaerobacter stomatis TaxID=796937 RepID=G9XAN3_9FIRM|nr:hypothetical protein [Peptoanaerobacter stomatis]EHL20053.1 hypothetical protein HMPREF9628_01050 [Peptoanaerobacter stomatis]